MSNRDYLRQIPIIRRLESCPFCGSNVSMVPMYDNVSAVHMMILCMNNDCAAAVQFTGEDRAEEISRRWNRRTKFPKLKTELASVYGKCCYDTNTSLTNE